MVRSLSQNWWLVVLRGILAILFGLAAFVWPGITWLTLVVMFGIYALIDGIVAIGTGLSNTKESSRWWVFVLEGLLGIGAGAVALFRPGLTALILIYIISAWAIVTGILEIAAAIRLRNEITNEWMLGLGGLISIALGVLLFLYPLAGGLAIIWTIAAYALIFGVLLVALGFRLKNRNVPDNRQAFRSA